MEYTEDWFHAGNFFKLSMRNVPVLEYLVAFTEHRSIVVHLSPCPKLQMPHLRLVIGILSKEVHALFKEILLLKLWLLREWLMLNWLKILLRNRRGDNNCSLGVEHDEGIVLIRCIFFSIVLRVRNFISWGLRLGSFIN